jgi:phosphoribosylformylglycinamidine synthase subunit PurQ / glutaminase
MMGQPNFIILGGDGINCERETADALTVAGAITRIVHINELCERPAILNSAQGLALPGGFSFGDELGSGQILALKLQARVKKQLHDFIEKKGAVIGICNGFQTLVKLNLLPDLKKSRFLTLTHNRQHHFIDRWVELEVNPQCHSPWITDLTSRVFFPIRHGEGRVAIAKESEARWAELERSGQLPLKYLEDVNGSHQNVAALCDPTGMVLGLMPHPEAAIYQKLCTHSTANGQWGDGHPLFKNMVNYLIQS